jgi:hypothetical protein
MALLATTITLAALASTETRQRPPAASTADTGDDLLAAVLPDHQGAAAAQASTMPRYTIAATLIPPSAALPEPPPTTPPPATPVSTPWASPVASPSASPQATPVVVAAETEAAAAHPAGAAPTPQVPPAPRIVGTLDLHYVNTTGAPLDELPVRLSPNLRQYGSGSMTVANVRVDGEPVDVEAPPLHSAPAATPIAIEDAGARGLAIVRIPLGAGLAPGAATTLRMDFATTVPIAPPDENGLFRYTPETGTWTLAHWFPMLAGRDPETGWEIDPPAAWSDITFGTTALFDITLTAPEDLVLVTTGVEIEATATDGRRTARITAGPVRDVAIIAAPGLASSSTEVGDTTLTSWYRPGEEAGGETILRWTAQAFAIFTELFGPYPYTTLDIVSVPEVIGHGFPQLVWIGSAFYADPEALGSRPGAIEFLVAHEVAHQWWSGLVGSNPHRHAFLDHGLSEYAAVVSFEWQHGADAAAAHLRDGLVHRYALMLATAGDQVADQPTADFPDRESYRATVSAKAGLGFGAVRQEIGDAAFFAALRSYAEAQHYGVAVPADLRGAFEAAAGRDLAGAWTLWFESDRGRVEIAMEPLPATPGPATPAASPSGAMPTGGTPAGTATRASPVASPIATRAARTPVASAVRLRATALPEPVLSFRGGQHPDWGLEPESPAARFGR